MKEDETITGFYVHVCNIANSSFALGEKMYEEKFGQKIPQIASK